jgi:hypothetical protein
MTEVLEPENSRNENDIFHKLVLSVRMILGLEFLLNGLNWWIKIIGPYPSISDYAGGKPVHPGFVGAMIATGFIFHIVKATELIAGIGLLANRWVPLCLVAVFPVTVNVFFVDVLMSTHLRAHIMGTGAMLMSIFLMLSYFSYYAPMLSIVTQPHRTIQSIQIPQYLQDIPSELGKRFILALGIMSALFGVVMLCWVGVMIIQTASGS